MEFLQKVYLAKCLKVWLVGTNKGCSSGQQAKKEAGSGSEGHFFLLKRCCSFSQSSRAFSGCCCQKKATTKCTRLLFHTKMFDCKHHKTQITKSWDGLEIANKRRKQSFLNLFNLYFIVHNMHRKYLFFFWSGPNMEKQHSGSMPLKSRTNFQMATKLFSTRITLNQNNTIRIQKNKWNYVSLYCFYVIKLKDNLILI